MRLYRGQAGVFSLRPSLFRKASDRKHEKNILREIVAMHPGEFRDDTSLFERLVRMQHFSLPTRLLDITFNPLVALYFCCANLKERDGEFISFALKESRIRYYDSDTVSCIANLANLTGVERDQLRKIDDLIELNSSKAGKRLLQFIKAEKPYFLPEIRPRDLHGVYVVKPRLANRRILAQQGAFIIYGLTSELDEGNDSEGLVVTRTPVPATAKTRLLRELDNIGINESTMFPEIESAARYVMSKLTPVEDDDELVD